MPLCSIQANSSDGFSNPVFASQMPVELGMESGKWNAFISEANQAVHFRWCPLGCICFFCNQHNKSVRPHMQALCEKWNKEGLPKGVRVQYEMKTEKQTVNSSQGGGKGATLETYHKLIFSSGAPEAQVMGG